jgi:hypothetical protein
MDDACGSASRVQRTRRTAASTARNHGDASMTFHRTSKVALLFAIACAATALSVTQSLAFSEAQQMCTGDAMRLCGHEVPNVQRITACMVRHRAQVSPGCRAVMDREHAARRRAAATE